MAFSRAELIARSAVFRRNVLTRLARAARRQARNAIPSRTLRRSMRSIVEPGNEGRRIGRAKLFIPEYWAVFYHDGRRAQRTRKGKKLVYFPNPADDPRIRGSSSPARKSETRHLTRQEFQRFMQLNRVRRAAGREPIMVVADSVGPSRGTHFFTRGMRSFPQSASRIVNAEVSALVRQLGLTEFRSGESATLDL